MSNTGQGRLSTHPSGRDRPEAGTKFCKFHQGLIPCRATYNMYTALEGRCRSHLTCDDRVGRDSLTTEVKVLQRINISAPPGISQTRHIAEIQGTCGMTGQASRCQPADSLPALSVRQSSRSPPSVLHQACAPRDASPRIPFVALTLAELGKEPSIPSMSTIMR